MKPVFADTAYYLALFNPGDIYHAAAKKRSRQLRRTVVVTQFVLLELANALSRANTRRLFTDLLRQLRSDPNAVIVPASGELFDRGCAAFAERLDKTWSLTDCISFVVMQEHGLTEALTADHHFEQAGFAAILK